MGIGAGDDVIVTPRTFLASASCIVTAGANPVFADVDLNSQNISAETIKVALTPNTKAIIVSTSPVCPPKWTASWTGQRT